MNNIYKLFGVVAIGAMALTSCDNEKFLDVKQYDKVDIAGEFATEAGAIDGLTGVYDLMNANDGPDGDWGFKPNLFTGTHPTMDTQATGWDVKFNSQAWNAETTELADGWAHAYAAIARANLYLKGLEDNKANFSEATYKQLEGQARALRGFFYTWLAQTFGRVPMLATGEDYSTAPEKAKAETYEEMWNFIIEDFQDAANNLDWKPMNGQYGRCTKGMAKAYLADAYMWKAYRLQCDNNGVFHENVSADVKACYTAAKKELGDIITSGTYKLNPSFCSNWDVNGGGWNDECIWAEILDEKGGGSNWDNRVSSLMTKWYTACPENGGWGSLYLSWEWYAAYEKGDKRRDASCVTGAVPKDQMAKYGIEPSPTNWGYHPFLQIYLGSKNADGSVSSNSKTLQFHFTNGEYAPAIWSTKFWRNASAEDLNGVGSWGKYMWSPTNIYWKRYANVLLDYAECCFFLDENSQEGWNAIQEVRDRAFGKLEAGLQDANYIGWFNHLAGEYGTPIMDSYPIPFNRDGKGAPDAKTYYTKYAKSNIKGKAFSSPVWKVAVNEERRKEFSCEWCLRPDMQRSNFMRDHIETNYPKDATSGEALANYPWSHRDFDYNEMKMDMPIPQDEIAKNPLCTQNPAYVGEKK